MGSIRTRFDSSFLGVPSLLFIYFLLGFLGLAYSSAYFSDALSSARPSGSIAIAAFLSIPLILIAFLATAVGRLIRDIRSKRPGGRLRARLLVYFVSTAFLASVPATVITARFIGGVMDSWYSADISGALQDARDFALDAYRYRLKVLERTATSRSIERSIRLAVSGDAAASAAVLAAEDTALVAVQAFERRADGTWVGLAVAGDAGRTLGAFPGAKQGFLPRDPERDGNSIRYVLAPGPTAIRVVTFDLGTDFDARVARIERAVGMADSARALRPRLSATLAILYFAFSLPTILMAVIIAFSMATAVTQPIVSLADATKRVAEGDFSVRIFARPNDELGILVAAFNAMVRDLEASRASILQVEKVNVWKEIAQRLAHEIKNPLTPIKLSAERVLKRWKNDPATLGEIIEESMMAVIQEVDGLSVMLVDFRDFARLPLPNLSWTPLRELVEETAALYRSSYPSVEFRYEAMDPALSAMIDRRHISRVLSNLIVNAVDAMNGSGILEFRSDLVKKRDCRYCRLSVRDNGAGIPEPDRALIFTPYFTTKASGTGLGLSIVERIVVDHGGTIWFDTAEGIGTTFYIDLPIDRSETASPSSGGEGAHHS